MTTDLAKELGEACTASWDALKDELFESLVCSTRDRVEAVINAKVGPRRPEVGCDLIYWL